MTAIEIKRQNDIRYQTILAFCMLTALTVAIFAGLKLQTAENCIILPKSPFEEERFFRAVIEICIWDVAAFWILSLPLSKMLTVISSFAVFFFRGMVIGSGFKTFFENSVPAIAITVLFSYCAVTLFAVFFGAYLNLPEKKSVPARILSCLVATGAAAIIRILPMLLL